MLGGLALSAAKDRVASASCGNRGVARLFSRSAPEEAVGAGDEDNEVGVGAGEILQHIVRQRQCTPCDIGGEVRPREAAQRQVLGRRRRYFPASIQARGWEPEPARVAESLGWAQARGGAVVCAQRVCCNQSSGSHNPMPLYDEY